jgi:hypothetical protein
MQGEPEARFLGFGTVAAASLADTHEAHAAQPTGN